MQEHKQPNRIHPLVAGAAVSVMLASLTGVAAITGMIPSSISAPTPEAALSTSPTGSTSAKPVTSSSQKTATRAQPSSSRVAQSSAPAVCSTCGTIESVHAYQQQAPASGVGMVAGAVLGGILGNQVGGGSGRTIATVAGAAGGGYVGNEVEKRSRATTTYQVMVRMEDGRTRSFSYAQQPGWSVGDRVRVVNGSLTSRA